MTLPVRRSVAELISRLELEQAVLDLYVEGPTDVSLIDWFLRKTGRTNFVVLPIEDIDLPDGLLPEGRPLSGNRDRVRGLAQLVQAHFGADVPPLICIADRDHEVLLAEPPVGPTLLLTEHASIEHLYLTADVLDRFLSLFIRRRVVDAGVLVEQLTLPLFEVFLVRVADRALRLGFATPPVESFCSRSGGALIDFDRDAFLARYLLRPGRLDLLAAVEAKITELRAVATALDYRPIHGHDFVSLLCSTLHPFVSDKRLVHPLIAQRGLMTSLDIVELCKVQPFAELLVRLPGTSG